MEKFVAIIFDTEEAAYAGAESLRELHRNGELAVYAAAVIGKDADGKVEVKTAKDSGPIGAGFGILLGAMVGVLAAPVAVASGAVIAGTAAVANAAVGGIALGGAAGGLIGMYRDLWVYGIDAAMLEQVSLELLPGKSCVVASVDEVWTTPLDAKMGQAGGVVFRKPRADVIDEQWESEMRMLDREMDDLKAEMKEAHESNKTAIQTKIEAAKASIQDQNDRITARLGKMDAEMDARVDALDEQISNANEQTKQKFVERKAEIQADYKVRKGKLRASAELAKGALTI